MKIVRAEFVTSGTAPAHYPDWDLPEVAFGGRSNVGKSSLINRLLSRRKLVRVSSTPGRTQQINFFVVNKVLGLVALPGYGYAKAPPAVRAKWGPMIRTYLDGRANLKGVVHILDARHRPTEQDLEFLDWLASREIPTVLAATKIDKVKPSKRLSALKVLVETLPFGAGPLISFSSASGEGKKELWAAIRDMSGV
ncbi:MAG: YihA family ribosome biogenesis GTP-binding protein [Deltaproteobacteria bacterium]|nr:YihA family ribosome biogenesis GTP-binding protein [Deltaproteobacteria bacterium]